MEHWLLSTFILAQIVIRSTTVLAALAAGPDRLVFSHSGHQGAIQFGVRRVLLVNCSRLKRGGTSKRHHSRRNQFRRRFHCSEQTRVVPKEFRAFEQRIHPSISVHPSIRPTSQPDIHSYPRIHTTPSKLKLGRHLGYFIFSLIGLRRTLFTNIFQRL